MNVRRSVAIWAILLGLAAVLWEAPVGLRDFAVTSPPTRVFYSVLTLAGAVLALAGAALLSLPRLSLGRLALVACAAAAVLAVNQTVGLLSSSILCFSAG
jgi:hypothetical protein